MIHPVFAYLPILKAVVLGDDPEALSIEKGLTV